MNGRIRMARPADCAPIAAVVDDWWGRPIAAALPRLFLDLGGHNGPGRDLMVFERALQPDSLRPSGRV